MMADLTLGCALEGGAALYPVWQMSKPQPSLQLGGKDCHAEGVVPGRHLHFLDVCA